MKTLLNLSLLLLLLLTACEPFWVEYDCDAIVVEKVNDGIISCNKDIYLLKFTRGLDVVEAITTVDYEVLDSTYAAINLPEKLKVPGLEIELNVRAPEAGEAPTCYNFEMPIMVAPLIVVVSADQK